MWSPISHHAIAKIACYIPVPIVTSPSYFNVTFWSHWKLGMRLACTGQICSLFGFQFRAHFVRLLSFSIHHLSSSMPNRNLSYSKNWLRPRNCLWKRWLLLKDHGYRSSYQRTVPFLLRWSFPLPGLMMPREQSSVTWLVTMVGGP